MEFPGKTRKTSLAQGGMLMKFPGKTRKKSLVPLKGGADGVSV